MRLNQLKSGLLAFSLAVLCFVVNACGQDKSSRPSPPATATGTINGTTVTINYSQPSVKGRKIWGGVVPYGQVWRSGANEATTIEFSKDVKVEGATLPAGKYGFFTLPGENEWVIIFNKVSDQWGAFKYDAAQDALRVKVKPQTSKASNEKLLYTIDKSKVNLFWENLEVSFSVK